MFPFIPHTQFNLTRGEGKTAERIRICTPPACPMFHEYPEHLRDMLAQGWRYTGHIDRYHGRS